jgi:hypothetical protein
MVNHFHSARRLDKSVVICNVTDMTTHPEFSGKRIFPSPINTNLLTSADASLNDISP